MGRAGMNGMSGKLVERLYMCQYINIEILDARTFICPKHCKPLRTRVPTQDPPPRARSNSAPRASAAARTDRDRVIVHGVIARSSCIVLTMLTGI